MYVILTYDVKQQRVAKVMKTCRKYLTHVQKSVFEGLISDSKLTSLKHELEKVILVEEDSVMILASPGQHSCNTRTHIPTTFGQAFLYYPDIHS